MRLLCLSMILLLAFPLMGKDEVVVKRIQIKGLKNIDKRELFKGAKTFIRGGRIHIDREALIEQLHGNPMVEKYFLNVKNNILVLEVVEKAPLFLVIMSRGRESVPYLFDGNMEIVERGLFFQTDMPIIEMEEEYPVEDEAKDALHKIFGILIHLRSQEKGLFKELSLIRVKSYEKSMVSLKGRNTRFLLSNNLSGFLKLGGTIKVLDSGDVSPNFLDLTEKFVLIR